MEQQQYRYRIAILGRQNAGKSCLLNRLLDRNVASVDEKPGATIDPVGGFAEFGELGRVMLVEVPAPETVAMLHAEAIPRIRRSYYNADLALIMVDASCGLEGLEQIISSELASFGVPYLVVANKTDNLPEDAESQLPQDAIRIDCLSGQGFDRLRQRIIELCQKLEKSEALLADLVRPGKVTLLVLPAAGNLEDAKTGSLQGRLVLEIAKRGGLAFVANPDETELALRTLSQPPDLVVTDSQYLPRVAAVIPEDTRLTTLAVLFARHKADLVTLVSGARAIDSLSSDSRVLILEANSTQPGFRDLANNKIPSWLERKVGCPLEFTRSPAERLREPIDHFDLVVHCGGYQLDKKQMDHRIKSIAAMGTPVVTFGILIAHLHGLLDRITCFVIAEEIRVD